MTAMQVSKEDARMQRAIDELSDLLRRRYPGAEFFVAPAPDDAAIVHLYARVDDDDADTVLDVVMDRMLALQFDEGLPIYVIPDLDRWRLAAPARAGECVIGSQNRGEH